ncbi:M20/M25/M40 family metallo-hydrolase [Nonomuraea sp. B1E8]|uniref:M20 family metallopeptidase n=1 Tax=unclassified Nonomuraea TaxID=2593643 RepID=UPI00325D20DF
MTNQAAQVEAWLDERAGEMADLLERLVAVDSENPPGRELRRCAGVLREAMDRLGPAPEVIDVADPSGGLADPCVVRGTAGDGGKLIYFHGHFDAVPAQSREQFTAVRRDGKIIGRGTADMKGGIVSMLYGAAAAKELGLLGDGRIVVHLVCDEETGSVAGAGHLRAAGLIDPGALAMITAEPSGGSIWHAARGAVSLRVDIQGREAHVGQADRGVNAFQHMLHIARPAERYAADLAGRHTAYRMNPGDARGSMLVVGGLSGGGSNFSTTQLQPSAATDQDHPAARALARVVGEVEGTPARFEMCAGILEIRWYAQLGIPAFGYGAGRLDVSHGPHEYVDEAAMRRCAAVYARYAGDLLT